MPAPILFDPSAFILAIYSLIATIPIIIALAVVLPMIVRARAKAECDRAWGRVIHQDKYRSKTLRH